MEQYLHLVLRGWIYQSLHGLLLRNIDPGTQMVNYQVVVDWILMDLNFVPLFMEAGDMCPQWKRQDTTTMIPQLDPR